MSLLAALASHPFTEYQALRQAPLAEVLEYFGAGSVYQAIVKDRRR